MNKIQKLNKVADMLFDSVVDGQTRNPERFSILYNYLRDGYNQTVDKDGLSFSFYGPFISWHDPHDKELWKDGLREYAARPLNVTVENEDPC